MLNDPNYSKIYIAHCRTILHENFTNGWYKTKAEQYRKLIKDAVKKDSNWVFQFEDFDRNYTATVIKKQPAPFPYPGITELMDARIKYLQNHPEYKKSPPVIGEIHTGVSEKDTSSITVNVSIENAKNAYIFFRKKSSDIFQKIPLYDDGKIVDLKALDGIFSAIIPKGEKKVEYYIFAENNEAVMFSPERAAHEFYTIKNTNLLPF